MKKIIFVTLCLLTASFASIAANQNTDAKNIISTVSAYQNVTGVEVISVGKLGLGLAKGIANLSAESKEDRAVLAIMNGINKLVLVNYEDAEAGKQK